MTIVTQSQLPLDLRPRPTGVLQCPTETPKQENGHRTSITRGGGVHRHSRLICPTMLSLKVSRDFQPHPGTSSDKERDGERKRRGDVKGDNRTRDNTHLSSVQWKVTGSQSPVLNSKVLRVPGVCLVLIHTSWWEFRLSFPRRPVVGVRSDIGHWTVRPWDQREVVSTYSRSSPSTQRSPGIYTPDSDQITPSWIKGLNTPWAIKIIDRIK